MGVPGLPVIRFGAKVPEACCPKYLQAIIVSTQNAPLQVIPATAAAITVSYPTGPA